MTSVSAIEEFNVKAHRTFSGSYKIGYMSLHATKYSRVGFQFTEGAVTSALHDYTRDGNLSGVNFT